MDITGLKRDPAKVHSALVEKDNMLITTRGVKIYLPVRYAERKLASVESDVSAVAIFGMVVDDKYYAVSKVCAMMPMKPSTRRTVVIDETEYFEFGFDPGAVICPNYFLIREDTLLYYIYDEIIAKGHIPWYFTYEDVGKLFVSSKKYAGADLSFSNTILEMIAASISRQRKDKSKFYRHGISSIAEQISNPPAYIPFRSVIYGANNTTARLLGSYFDDSMLSALVNPSERTEAVETILRM